MTFKTAFITFALAATGGCVSTNSGGPSPLLGKPAPDFSLTSTDGRKLSVAQLRGKVVILDFWATWCPPCRQALPHLQELATDPHLRSQGLEVIAVNEKEGSQEIQSFLDQFRYSFTVVRDTDGSIARAYAVIGLPATVIIARDGTVRSFITGFDKSTPDQIKDAVAKSL